MVVNFSLNDSFFIFKSKRFENIYSVLVNKKHIFKMSELFTLCASIGFRKGRSQKIEQRGTEMRSEHFKENQLSALYSIILSDPDMGGDIEKFRDYDFIKSAFKTIEEYAEGGMEELCEKVFEDKWNGLVLNEEYDEYEIDILRYVYDTCSEAVGF